MTDTTVNRFLDEDYKSWVVKLSQDGAIVTSVIRFPNGRILLSGNPDRGIEDIKKAVKGQKLRNKDWIPDITGFAGLDAPLGKMYKNQNFAKKFASSTIRHFIGKSVSFGTGECLLWEVKVPVDKLTYSKGELADVWNSPVVSLENVVLWKDFKIKSFGRKISDSHLNFKILWRALCILIIEIGYNVLGLNPDKEMEAFDEPDASIDEDIIHEVDVQPVVAEVHPEPEILREEPRTNGIKLLKPCLKDYHENGSTKNINLQIIDIVKTDDELKFRLSDGEAWLLVLVNKLFWGKVDSSVINKFDILKDCIFSGNVESENLMLDQFCKPRSYQMKKPSLIGAPLPVLVSTFVSQRVSKRKRAPVVPELLAEDLGPRYVVYS